MAEAVPGTPEDNNDSSLEKIMSCPVCFEYMTDSCTLTNCMHTFCKRCIQQLQAKPKQGGKFSCPLCRDVVDKNLVKTNLLMNSLVEHLTDTNQNKKGPETKLCIQCEGCDITHHCVQCEGDLCTKCARRHDKIRVCRNHTIVSRDQAKEVKVKNMTVYCQRHPHEEIKMNCVPCNVAICSQCKFENHDTHKSESVGAALTKCRILIQEAINDSTQDERKGQIQAIKVQHNIITNNQRHLTDEVKKQMNKIMSKIKEEHDNLVSSIDTNATAQLKQLELKMEELSMAVSSDESILNWIKAISENTDGAVLLIELQSGLMQKLAHLKTGKMYDNTVPSLRLLTLISPEKAESGGKFLGELQYETDPVTFRNTDRDLCELQMSQEITILDLKTKEKPHRMCIFEDSIWIPCLTEGIAVFSYMGKLLKTIAFETEGTYYSLYPISKQQLISSTEKALYRINAAGTVISIVTKGFFIDISIAGNTMAAVSTSTRNIYLWDIRNLKQVAGVIPLQGELSSKCTLILSNSNVCVCDELQVRKYTFQGQCTATHKPPSVGKGRRKLFVCTSDTNHKVLLLDESRNEMIVLAENGKARMINCNPHIKNPTDVVIHRNKIFVLCNSGSNIAIIDIE